MRALSAATMIALLAGCAPVPENLPYAVQRVAASAETEPMRGRGDRADDPAIWLHPANVSRSLILGTNKAEGLYVYSIDGAELQRLPVGMVNNVDIRGLLAVASNDEFNALSWFRIDPNRIENPVHHLGDTLVERMEPYGVCLGRIDGNLIAGVTYKDGAVELWAAGDRGAQVPETRLIRTVRFASQLEGCVFDDEERRLFVGEEGHGIWALDLTEADTPAMEVDSISAGNGLVADVEGLSLYTDDNGNGYLVASAQSADRLVIYDRLPPFSPVGAVTIGASQDGAIDAVTHTDGLDITSAVLPDYPRGLLVVQDDGNPGSGIDQNFKLVDWRAIDAAIRRLKASQAESP